MDSKAKYEGLKAMTNLMAKNYAKENMIYHKQEEPLRRTMYLLKLEDEKRHK